MCQGYWELYKNGKRMKYPKVIIIAANQPLDNDAHFRAKMESAEKRAQRQAARFPHVDLPGLQKGVHKNLKSSILEINGKFMDLLDLMNFLKNNEDLPKLDAGNIKCFYSLADTVSHNGIYLYQYLKKAGYDPIIVQNYSLANLNDLLDPPPLAVCISSNFIFMDEIKAMGEEIKKYAPETNVIAGGMLVKKVLDEGNQLPDQALRYFSTFSGKIDAFVIEALGEQTLVRLLDALQNAGTPLSHIPNLGLFDHQGKIFFTPREAEYLHMDETVIPWQSIPREYLRETLPVNTSRGCYYRCKFCTYHWLFPKVHFKSLDVLRQELKAVQALGFVRHVRFTDDNFTANEKRLRSVLQMMIEEKFEFSWSSFARASALKPDLVQLMKKSGCEFVDMGIESGSQKILDLMDKRLKREQSLEAIRMLNDNGIWSRGSFIIGYPGETVETFEETIDLINSSGIPYYHPYLFYYSRNTIIHREKDKFGLEGLGLAWKHNTMDSVKASELLASMTGLIDQGYTDGLSYIEEIYKYLRARNYSPEEIFNLFKLKRELQYTLKKEGENSKFHGILEKMKSIIK